MVISNCSISLIGARIHLLCCRVVGRGDSYDPARLSFCISAGVPHAFLTCERKSAKLEWISLPSPDDLCCGGGWLQWDAKNRRTRHMRASLSLPRLAWPWRSDWAIFDWNWRPKLSNFWPSGCEQLPADFAFITPLVDCDVGLGTNRNDLMVDYIAWWHKCMKCINFNKSKTDADAEALAICIWRLRGLCKRSCHWGWAVI